MAVERGSADMTQGAPIEDTQETLQENTQETTEEVKETVQEAPQVEATSEEAKGEEGKSEEDVKLPTIPEEKAEEQTKKEEDTGAEPENEKAMIEALQELVFKDEVTEEDLKPLVSKGYDPAVLQLTLKGMKAEVKEVVDGLYKEVGGKEQWQELAEWATANLNEDEKTEFNELMTSGDTKAMKWAMRGLKALHATQSASNEPQMLSGTADATPSIKPFANYRAYIEAVKDPRYNKSAEYRAQVDKAFELSAKLGRL